MPREALQILTFGGVFVVAFAAAALARRLVALPDRPSDRYLHLDGLRGLAALCVVAAHASQYAAVATGAPGLTTEMQRHMGATGVQIFFALTAFLFTERALAGRLEPYIFFQSRLRRIMPLYVTLCSVAVLISFVLGLDTGTVRRTLYGVVGIFLFGIIGAKEPGIWGFDALYLIGVAWTLPYEWGFYLMLPLAYAVARQSRAHALAVLAGLVIVAAYTLHIGNRYAIWSFFLPGIAVALLKGQIASPPSRWIKTVLGVIGGAAFTAAALAPTGPRSYTILHLGLIVVGFATVMLVEPVWLKRPVLVFLGQISFSIYLWQLTAFFPLVLVGRHYYPLERGAGIGAALAIVAGLIFASAWSFKYVEWPFMARRGASTEPRVAATERQF
jgi:peptidoglycan/LPS O-acetylase OafA/YrhL